MQIVKIVPAGQDKASPLGTEELNRLTTGPTCCPPIPKPGMEEELNRLRTRKKGLGFFSLYRVYRRPVCCGMIEPVDYLKASGEAIFILLVVCWIITAIANPEIVKDNALKNMIGYNNPCVGWDVAPASYVGLVGAVGAAQLSWNYASLDLARTIITEKEKGAFLLSGYSLTSQFSVFSDVLFGVSTSLFPLLFLIGPSDGRWGWHTAIFVQFIFCRYLVCLANYLEAEPRYKTQGAFGFIVVYGAVSMLLPILYFVAIYVYCAEGRTGQDPVLPWWFTCSVDYVWMCCVPLSTRFLPDAPPLLMENRIAKHLRV